MELILVSTCIRMPKTLPATIRVRLAKRSMFLRLLDEAGLKPGDLAYPVYYDLEENSQANLGPSKIADLATTFCNIISDAGYDVGIYANQNWWRNYLTDSVFRQRDGINGLLAIQDPIRQLTVAFRERKYGNFLTAETLTVSTETAI